MRRACARRLWRLRLFFTALMLVLWAAVTCLPVLWNYGSATMIFGWPSAFWLTAYGAPLAYLALIVIYAFVMNRQSASTRGQED